MIRCRSSQQSTRIRERTVNNARTHDGCNWVCDERIAGRSIENINKCTMRRSYVYEESTGVVTLACTVNYARAQSRGGSFYTLPSQSGYLLATASIRKLARLQDTFRKPPWVWPSKCRTQSASKPAFSLQRIMWYWRARALLFARGLSTIHSSLCSISVRNVSFSDVSWLACSSSKEENWEAGKLRPTRLKSPQCE